MTVFLTRLQASIIALALTATMLSACEASSIGEVNATQPPAATATLPAATPTSITIPTVTPGTGAIKSDCSNYRLEPNKDVYGNIPLPPGSLIGNAGAAAGTYYEFVCTPNGTTASINTFMDSAPAQSGWTWLTTTNAPPCLHSIVPGHEWLKDTFLFTWAFALAGQETRVQGPPTWVIMGNDITIFGCK